MTEDQLPDDAPPPQPESWLEKLAEIVPQLGKDDIRDLNDVFEGVQVTPSNAVDLNQRVHSGAYDVLPPALER